MACIKEKKEERRTNNIYKKKREHKLSEKILVTKKNIKFNKEKFISILCESPMIYVFLSKFPIVDQY